MLNDDEIDTLKKLGQRLKSARLELDYSQQEFAFKIGVSIPTLHKMEHGNPSMKLNAWTKALSILGRLDEINRLIAPYESLFKRVETEKKIKYRQRASKKSKRGK